MEKKDILLDQCIRCYVLCGNTVSPFYPVDFLEKELKKRNEINNDKTEKQKNKKEV